MRNKFKLAVIALAGLGALTVSGFGQGPDPADQYYESIRRNDLPMIHAMVNSNGVKFKDKHATTPLHYAAAYGSLEAFRAILSAGPDVNAQNEFGATPLMWAVTEPEKVRCWWLPGRMSTPQDGAHGVVPGGGQRWLLCHGPVPAGARGESGRADCGGGRDGERSGLGPPAG